MTDQDRKRWDDRYAERGGAAAPNAPSALARFAGLLPESGTALDVACGRGEAAVWLAQRGLHVLGVDVSSVAISAAMELADLCGVAERCDFIVADLDNGLPEGAEVDLVLCHLFHDADLAPQLIARLRPGATLAVACLSQVGGSEGRFHAPPGELRRCYGSLDIVVEGEADGHAWLIARRPI